MASTNDVLRTAKHMFENDYESVMKNGVLLPSKNRNPIFPPLTVVEYAAMEKDTSKYFLYYAAIHAEIYSLKKKVSCNSRINCMVIGAGRGRLVDYCLDCFSELNINGFIFVVECNVSANSFLQQRYKNTENVTVLPPWVIRTEEELLLASDLHLCNEIMTRLVENSSIDLFVSELLGSFGDNEFISEILSVSVKMFGRSSCVSIPSSYSTYISAIYSPSLQIYFAEHTDPAIYILGLPKDAIVVSNIVKLYDQSSTITREEIQSIINLTIMTKTIPPYVTGLAGHFRAKLSHDIVIDTTITDTRNTFFWETAFFPLPNLSLKTETKIITVNFKRNSFRKSVKKETIFNLEYPVLIASYNWRAITDDNDSSYGTHQVSL